MHTGETLCNKAFIQHCHLKNIKEFILKKNCMSGNVVKTLGVILHFSQLQQRTHRRKKTVYKCEQCSKIFLWHNKVTNHERIHTGEKLYYCKQCGIAFRCSSHLQRCERAHTGEKPYEYKQCAKTFIQKHFSYTESLHWILMPYECKQCVTDFRCYIVFYCGGKSSY